MQKNYSQLLIGIIIGIVLGLVIGKQVFVSQSQPSVNQTSSSQETSPKEIPKNAPQADYNHSEIPQKVYDLLKYIRANNRAMDGYVGGRVFTNREKIVPQFDAGGRPIQYQEWDVNPKVEGQNRGTERILTGSDGRAWYTNDHYQSFKEIK